MHKEKAIYAEHFVGTKRDLLWEPVFIKGKQNGFINYQNYRNKMITTPNLERKWLQYRHFWIPLK